MRATSRAPGIRMPGTRPRAEQVRHAALALAALACVLVGCTIPTDGAATARGQIGGAPEPVPEVTAQVPRPASSTPLAGRTVFLDPGHSGSQDAAMTAQVPTGRGDTKDCQTTGTATDDGYPEHTFTWQVVGLMRTGLEQLGARVVLSRTDDTSVGNCVDERAALANASGADAVVSIHADGAGQDQRGFHVCYSAPPLNDVQAGASVTFATTMRDTLVAAGLTPANYTGTAGLQPRADLAGLNLSERPSILVELGNMRSPDEAREMTDEAGRARYARAVVQGVVGYLAG
ncbi:Rv3717 family N-acetylmuramoyl-L-alanine amidase [Rhodococcus sp. NPDC003318]|uniref:Rv3717 family N-acetylmuramoyl-L-alanine amidase n=1 Tax=Rhodococcus sp. NPDC003318 TaxID=3364503 RepID=UPI0036A8DBE9